VQFLARESSLALFKFVKCLQHCTTHITNKQVDWGLYFTCACVCASLVRIRRSVYDVTVTPKYDKPSSAGSRPVQKVQVMVPGPPDAPQIWTRRSRHRVSDGAVEEGEDEAVVEWTEPRLNGAKVAGYQVYINGKKTGSVLASSHRKAIIPLNAKRSVEPTRCCCCAV